MLFCLTANHHNTDFAVLDHVSRVADSTAADLVSEHSFIRGAVVLATCNRFEAYIDVEEPLTAAPAIAREAILSAVIDRAGSHAETLRASAVSLSGDDAVRHLFAVSSGLESMVVGEEEISGQVQRALGAARESGTTSSDLETAFQRAAHAARQVRAKTDLGKAGRSLARLALDLIESRVADWAAVRVLIVGTGSYAATTIATLQARGSRDIRVFSATGRAERFAARYGLRAEPVLRDAIGDADIVITCTARYVVTPMDVPAHQPRLIVDLGLPRNVDPAVGAIPGVDVLDLELIGRHAALPELGRGAHEMVGSAAAVFAAEQAAAPAIVALRTHIQDALAVEIDRARPHDHDGRTERALRHLAGVLSHTPSVRARESAADGRLDEFEAALGVVFGIEPASSVTLAAVRNAGA